jgi:hypothetical protein
MNPSIQTFLRRTSGVCILLASFGFAPGAAAQTVTLSNGQSCTYTSMTVQPSGNVAVTCQTQGGSGAAVFSVFPAAASITVGSAGGATVSRSGGQGTLNVNYTVTGSGCNNSAGGLTFPENGAAQSISVTGTAAGSCVVTIAAPAGHSANPDTATISVTSAGGGGGGGGGVPGCPAPASNTLTQVIPFGIPTVIRQQSTVVGAYPIPALASASGIFTQGGMAGSPGRGTLTEFSISKCPGVIDSSVPQCYWSSGQTSYNEIGFIQRPTGGINSQAAAGFSACWAPESEGQWYVNVRWTYALCGNSQGCIFSMAFGTGPY